MNEGKDSLDTHEIMEYVERPWGKKVIPVHWVYYVKVDEFGNATRFKARLVAGGHRKMPGTDLVEKFGPTSSFGPRRALLSVTAVRDDKIHHLDIETAFCNDIEKEVYITQPPSFDSGDPRIVRRLNNCCKVES